MRPDLFRVVVIHGIIGALVCAAIIAGIVSLWRSL